MSVIDPFLPMMGGRFRASQIADLGTSRSGKELVIGSYCFILPQS